VTTFSPGKLSATDLQAMRDDLDDLIAGVGSNKVATADQSAAVNSSTLVSDTTLTCPVTAGMTYSIRGFIIYSASAAADFKWAFAIPTGTLHWSAHKYSPADVLELVQATNIVVSDNTNVAGGPGTSNYRHIVIAGSFAATATGFVTIRFASSVATGGEAATRATGSWLTVQPAYG
jgi:hypothetical protein